MKTDFQGIVHGDTIRLTEDAGLPDGQPVRVKVMPSTPTGSSVSINARDALRRAAGSWSDDTAELDRYLEWNRQQRKGVRREIVE